MRDELVEPGGIISDAEGVLFRVLSVDDLGIFMLMLPERIDVIHTRNITWTQFKERGYELKFP